jgi:leader peptidase (prepilin peptidase) / N-methyltransferase
MGELATATLVGVAGLAAGSLANLVIHQDPQHRRRWAPRASRCPACTAPIAWHDKLPVLGWLLRAGRCRACRAAVPVRPLLVELTMSVLWFLVALRLVADGLGWAVPAYLVLVFVCLVLTVIDLTSRLLPNRITYPAFPVVAVWLLLASVGLGDLARFGRALAAAAAVGVLFLLLALIAPSSLGSGDVKLAPTLGLALGWLSWAAVAVGMFSAFFLGGVAAVTAMLVLRLSRKAQLPFGPWLAAGALLGVLAGSEVARWYGHLGA